MSKEEKDNPGRITAELCEAYRGALAGQILDLKDNLKRMEGRQWAILTSVILTILLTILSIYIRL